MVLIKLSSCFLFVLLIVCFISSEKVERSAAAVNRQQYIQYSVRDGRMLLSNGKRSYRCLIEQVARKNNINATYTKISSKGTPHQPIYTFRLHLGRESYLASSSSMKTAKEKVSREAYGATHYGKPKLKDRTCKNFHSDVSHVNEWAQRRGYQFTCSIVDQKLGPPIIFTHECSILGTSYRARADHSIKTQAQMAAAQEIKRQIERSPDIMSRFDQGLKYNSTNHFYLNPVSRLSQIQTARHQTDPVYGTIQEVPGFSNKTHREQKTFIVRVKAKQNNDLEFTGIGRGTSLKESKYAAAVNVLGMMNYHVPSNMTKYKKREK